MKRYLTIGVLQSQRGPSCAMAKSFLFATTYTMHCLPRKNYGAVVPLWIDSICINQDDEAEKSSQIGLMGTIYGTARRVWAFLGQAPPRMPELIEYLPQILKGCQNLQKQVDDYVPKVAFSRTNLPGQTAVNRLATTLEISNKDMERIAPPHSPIWKTLELVLTERYFNRL